MKIEFNRKSLVDALGIVGAAIPSRTTKPVLQNALLAVASGKAELVCTDSEISIQHVVSDVVCSGGATVLLPVRRVSEVLKEMGDDRVTMDVDEKAVRISGERSRCNIPTVDPVEFPSSQSVSDLGYFTIPGSLLKKMIRRTTFATDANGTSPVYGGVLFEVVKNKLAMVATDKRRMALFNASVETADKESSGVLQVVPCKALHLVERAIPDSDDVVEVGFSANQVLFKTELSTITSRLIEGRFPRYRDVIPKSHNISVDVLAGALHGLTRQSQIFALEETCGVDFLFSDGLLKLSSGGAEVGNAEAELPISFDGNPVTIRLDARKISDFLKTVPGESQVNVKIADDESPAVITTEDGSIYLIMSMTTEG